MSRWIRSAAFVLCACWGSAGCASLSLFGSTHTHHHKHDCDCEDRLAALEARVAALEASRHIITSPPTFP